MIKKGLFWLSALGWAWNAQAAPQNFAKYFEIDLDAPLPTLAELNEKYVKPNVLYDRRYDYGWNIGNVFDDVFKLTISTYGSREKRMPDANEEALLNLLNSIPKSMYEYIGPYLHSVPGISEKVLNMPGIKETKNKFPSRIAPQLADIEDLEFLSPSLYFILMPEVWPQKMEMLEIPKLYKTSPKAAYDPKFYEELRKIVPPEKFMSGAEKAEKITRSDFRTMHPDKYSPLTSADIKAFINTLDEVDAFAKRDNNRLELYNIGLLLDMYEKEHGNGLMINEVKDMVNPCQRLAQKLKIAGPLKENEFTAIVGKQGFTLKEWAYTCDKTIKAFRVSNVSMSTLQSILAYKRGIYNQSVTAFNEAVAGAQFATMQSVVEMYRAPLRDVLEARKNRKELREKFIKMDNMLVSSPVESLD